MERLRLDNRQFTQGNVLQILPWVTAKNLQNWNSRGVLDNIDDVAGRGNRRLYSGIDIVIIDFISKVVDFGVPPSNAKKMADRVANCAKELWDLRIDELRPNGMRQLIAPASNTNSEYRRGFIFKYYDGYQIEIGRTERVATPPFYAIATVDRSNINTINLINRFLAGLNSVVVHIPDNFDDEGPDIDSKKALILHKIRSLPFDEWSEPS